ncbi:aminopeptidase [Haloferax sp. MBLA0076]|uniref:Aminopeptidase n=1 Tax=Haloferax litoreum TaxID=2666140 RepID=A0A6A8GE75_9EURY|nr:MULTISPECIES: aminopeptidase [Haloferax]KAB1192651.1 aminopeptidase [Haloferax sp. CBA1148]MRX21126.1 aminopeptidase [Haloferax litoreum]
MDPRIQQHAAVLVDHSISVNPGDSVIIAAPGLAEDLVVALYEKLGERGARPTTIANDSRAHSAYMRTIDREELTLNEAQLAALKQADALISIRAGENSFENSDIDSKKTMVDQQVNKPLSEEVRRTRWVVTQFPAPGNAQLAEMSTGAYEEFVYSAVNKDWDAQREHQQQMVDLLNEADEVRIRSGDATELSMSIEGMVAANDFGENNLPGGEVFTAPVPDSVEGTVLFDMPLLAQGREVQGVWLQFEDGEVVDYSAEKNQEILDAVLDTDDGARRLGELGIGMNRDIDRFTSNILFDEKMGDTIHLALGKAMEKNVPDGRKGNESAVHLDMLVDMSEDSTIELDGDVVQRNGTFVFEDDF